ncbi:hypothetical protein RIF23_17025 [Lipingzhangella sp. LS1_29]|uniref:Uncharacterized protein n=1 Tax=Lipingzhangella rawalii TaxID=2055835 RepID=A0ABU2HAF6_9ACTN|nr:hypothetical protein [Lipingzhangella rawalii]MDS1271997.1 hypothetical protein [Lipingzhangella rawalii]
MSVLPGSILLHGLRKPALAAATAVAATGLLAGCEFHRYSCSDGQCELTSNSYYEEDLDNGDVFELVEIVPDESVTVRVERTEEARLSPGESADVGGHTVTLTDLSGDTAELHIDARLDTYDPDRGPDPFD